jgi:O-antigen/teichoic acid export membrane protein
MNETHHSSVAADAKRVVLGLQWTYVSVVVQGALKLVVLVVLARVLTPRDFGLLGFALLCTNFVERLGQVGVAPALVQTQSFNADTLASARILSVVFGCICGAIVFIGAGYMADFFREDSLTLILQVLAIGCVLEGIAATPDALLQREMRFREIMVADNSSYCLAMGCVGVGLALMGYGVWSLVAAHLTLKAARAALVVRFVCPMPRGRWSAVEGYRLVRLGFGFSLGRILNFFSLQGDNFVVGRLLGVESLGMYNRAYQLMTLPAMYVGQVFERVMFPSMARKQQSRERLVREFLLTLEAITLVALPAGVVMFFLAREIVLVGFGERWSAAIPVVSILSFGVFFRTSYKCSDTVVRSVGAVYHYAARQALYTVLVVVGSLLGAYSAGLVGVAVGVVGAVAINYLSMTRLSSKMIGIPLSDIAYAHYSGCVVAGGVGFGLSLVLPKLRAAADQPLVVLLAGGCMAAVCWLVGLLVARQVFNSGVLVKATEYLQQTRLQRCKS